MRNTLTVFLEYDETAVTFPLHTNSYTESISKHFNVRDPVHISRDPVHIRNENNENHPIEFNPFKTEAVII